MLNEPHTIKDGSEDIKMLPPKSKDTRCVFFFHSFSVRYMCRVFLRNGAPGLTLPLDPHPMCRAGRAQAAQQNLPELLSTVMALL